MSGVGLAPVSPAAERGGTIRDGESNTVELGEPSGLGGGASSLKSRSTRKPVSQLDNQTVSQPDHQPVSQLDHQPVSK